LRDSGEEIQHGRIEDATAVCVHRLERLFGRECRAIRAVRR
jgi:hypothetical protein